jgi:trimethylamine-N-oxide reductase (cytochrome c)
LHESSAVGIAAGHLCRDRGQLLAGAMLTEDIRPGAIRVNEGGWFDPLGPDKVGSLCKYGDVNTLTLDIGTSRLAQGNCGQTVVGVVEKYQGAPPEVTAFSAPMGSAYTKLH